MYRFQTSGRISMPMVAILAVVLLVVSAAVAYAAAATPQHITNKVVTAYSWTSTANNNRVCPKSPDITHIDQTLAGQITGDPRESGSATVHVRGYEDNTNGAGFLMMNVEVRSPNGEAVANEDGLVTLSNPSKAFLVNRLNGLIAGVSQPGSSTTQLPSSWPLSRVVTNITGLVTYAGGASPAPPLVINQISGTIGDAVTPDGPTAGPQRIPTDDNPGVFMPAGAC